ncbi:MAG TPA: helix-turn-helix domain-containing protein [Thermomicrobiales bacterium]|nr:helix-turn-helix domain-containing protein [Thermomicrobiales bacterium]
MSSEQLWTVEEASARLRIHPESLRRWLREGKVAGYRLSRRAGWRVPEEEIQRLLQEGLADSKLAA